MASAGFLRDTTRASGKEIETLQDVQKLLTSEIQSVQEFESLLMVEIRELEDLKNNLQIVIGQMNHVKKLAQSKEDVVKKLIHEAQKRATEVDIKLADEYIAMINQIDQSVRPMVMRMYEEMGNLIISDTHKLYKRSASISKQMHEIDEHAREIETELRILEGDISALDEHVNDLLPRLQLLRHQRGQGYEPKGPLGYKT